MRSADVSVTAPGKVTQAPAPALPFWNCQTPLRVSRAITATPKSDRSSTSETWVARSCAKDAPGMAVAGSASSKMTLSRVAFVSTTGESLICVTFRWMVRTALLYAGFRRTVSRRLTGAVLPLAAPSVWSHALNDMSAAP